MAIWAIVPVKPFSLAKSRLAGILTSYQRAELSRQLLSRTLEVLAQVPTISRTLVISRDPSALALARRYHANTVTESGVSDLNLALQRATELARTFGAHAVLILPADLPRLTPSDVTHMLETRTTGSLAAPAPSTLIIAPDRHERGTNALFVRPPDLISFAFGVESFRKHLAHAFALGLQARVVRLPNLALDLDTPEDWTIVQGAPSHIMASQSV